MKKMKKLFVTCLALAMICTVFTACGNTKDNSASGDESARTKFVVGFDAEYPPYGYMDENGEYVGFDLDLAAEVCKRNGWELVKLRLTGMPRIWN